MKDAPCIVFVNLRYDTGGACPSFPIIHGVQAVHAGTWRNTGSAFLCRKNELLTLSLEPMT